jgi:hypothetical protein
MSGKRKDLMQNEILNNAQQSYGVGDLYSENGHPLTSPQQAKELGSNLTNQSYNNRNQPHPKEVFSKQDQVKTMSKTVIPHSGKPVKNPGKNQEYVNSRSGGPKENLMTKNASIKHENPEYFKRQADRKHMDQFPFQTKEIYKGSKI